MARPGSEHWVTISLQVSESCLASHWSVAINTVFSLAESPQQQVTDVLALHNCRTPDMFENYYFSLSGCFNYNIIVSLFNYRP